MAMSIVYRKWCNIVHHGLNKNPTWISPTLHLPSFLNNGLDSYRLTDENICVSLAFDCNRDDSDTSMITESSFNPAPNATSTPKCNNKNIKSI